MIWFRLLIVVFTILFVVLVARLFTKKQRSSIIDEAFASTTSGIVKLPKMMNIERRIAEKFNLTSPHQIHVYLIAERILVAVAFVSVFVLLNWAGVALLLCGVSILVFQDMGKQAIYESGVESIGEIMSFINYFVPSIIAGNSATQAMSKYVEESRNDHLREWYMNNSESFVPDGNIKDIINIYHVAVYNESLGNNNFINILEEIQRDYTQKQRYYTNFITNMAKIKPIEWSYFAGIPALLILGYSQTTEFWGGFGGMICGLLLAGMFCMFQFFTFRLRKSTITKIL